MGRKKDVGKVGSVRGLVRFFLVTRVKSTGMCYLEGHLLQGQSVYSDKSHFHTTKKLSTKITLSFPFFSSFFLYKNNVNRAKLRDLPELNYLFKIELLN